MRLQTQKPAMSILSLSVLTLGRVRAAGLCLVVAATFLALSTGSLAAALSVKPSTEKRYGAHIDGQDWVHFVIFASSAQAVNLLLFETPDATPPVQVIPMKKVGEAWKIRVKGLSV